MDNLIHASATPQRPSARSNCGSNPTTSRPSCRSTPRRSCDSLYYFNDGKLSTEYVPGGVCLLAPGDIAWSSDLEALRLMGGGAAGPLHLGTVAAKYLINEQRGDL